MPTRIGTTYWLYHFSSSHQHSQLQSVATSYDVASLWPAPSPAPPRCCCASRSPGADGSSAPAFGSSGAAPPGASHASQGGPAGGAPPLHGPMPSCCSFAPCPRAGCLRPPPTNP